jgi:hypothetical protein
MWPSGRNQGMELRPVAQLGRDWIRCPNSAVGRMRVYSRCWRSIAGLVADVWSSDRSSFRLTGGATSRAQKRLYAHQTLEGFYNCGSCHVQKWAQKGGRACRTNPCKSRRVERAPPPQPSRKRCSETRRSRSRLGRPSGIGAVSAITPSRISFTWISAASDVVDIESPHLIGTRHRDGT